MRPNLLALPVILLVSFALSPAPAAAGEAEALAFRALTDYRAGSLEAALEGLEASTLALSRELMSLANAEPIEIAAVRFQRPADTGEAMLDAPPVAERPGECFLRVDASGSTARSGGAASATTCAIQ
jgi:hypothetical protein